MKITSIEAIHLRAEDPLIELFDGSYDDCVLVVHTDSGLIGIGETESMAPAIQAIVRGPSAHNHARSLSAILVGADPSDPVELWNRMYESTDYVGRRGLIMHAIGGVDLALWDLKGKIEGKPVHELLGGAKRDRLPAYGTIYPMAQTPAAVKEQVATGKAKNLRNFKFAADPWWLDDISHTGRLLTAAREQAGPEAKIIIDAALSYRTAKEGLKLIPIFREVGIWFLEAPLPLDDVEGHLEMSQHGLPTGVGDLGLTHVREFIEMMDYGGASICQPDISQVGGFTGIRQIAAAAYSRGKRVITHGYKTNIEIAANLHFLAAQPNVEPLEFSLSHSPLRWQTTNEHFQVEEDGCVRVSQTPGLGVTLNPETIERYRFGN
ncbi:mandelate racemase/muconate lactonizing enzyme family protein [Acidicapsa dinghuensis]|uniref:Mandelate racemase/muconate lactonizing enzyme family protein n=1 Tax=Acidicapsa dinghuensis TaxID=2218256 RepID=A0ABW1EI36_9BACT|nr:mandelate racemase/muconate lactonizing enzyme family protein [Acidicapsa dinghuensis]